jgi:hypothetical protein
MSGRSVNLDPCPDVTSELGKTEYPVAAMAGGSNLAASVSPAVFEACRKLRAQLVEALLAKKGPLAGRGKPSCALPTAWCSSKATAANSRTARS